MRTYKLLIINDTDVNMISFIRSNNKENHELGKLVYAYEAIDITIDKEEKALAKKTSASKPVDFRLNVIEVKRVSECTKNWNHTSYALFI